MNYAVLNLKTGAICYKSEMIDEEEFPEEIEASDDYVWIPHKSELELGEELVFEFVSQRIHEEGASIKRLFRRKGAYANFRNLLERTGKLEEWYAFEREATEAALREWCFENGVDLE